MQNLFEIQQPSPKKMYKDLFGEYDESLRFRWTVAKFSADGALIARKHAIHNGLEWFYPWAYNRKSQPYFILPTYLFIEWRPIITFNICRKTSKFLYLLPKNNEPELVERKSINSIVEGLKEGLYDKRPRTTTFKAGTEVIITAGALKSYKATLLENVTSAMSKDHEVCIDIGWYRTKIKIGNLEF